MPTPAIPPAQPTLTETAAPSPTASPTHAPTRTAQHTPSATPAGQVEQDCFAVVDAIPKGATYQGVAALYDPERFTYELVDFQTGVKKSLIGKIYDRLVVSPNQKYFAYHSESANQLRIISAAGKLTHLLAWEKDWGYVGYLWDDGRVLVELAIPDPNAPTWDIYPTTLVVIDPSTGKRKILPPNFPEINKATYIVWGGFGATVYDPTLARVVYPSSGGESGSAFRLWDVKGGRLVSEDLVGWGGIPVWFKDGSRFLINGRLGDFLLISREGVSTQVTHLNQAGGEQYHSTSYSLSPDEKKAALWLNRLGDPTYPHLALLDLETGRVSDLCIPTGTAPRGGLLDQEPAWSPDGKAFLVEVGGQGEKGGSAALLVDLEKKLAIKIASSRRPDGWLAAGE